MPRKIILEKVFDQKITDRVKTFRDACDILGIDEYDGLIYENPKNNKSVNAYIKLTIIAEVLNEGWKPNWEDSSEYKHYPYFEVGSGFRFSDYYFTFTFTSTFAGARLVFKTKTLAEYAGRQFENLYKDFLLL